METIIAGIFGLVIATVIVWNSFVQMGNISCLDSWKKTVGKVIECGTFRVTHANRSAPAYQFAPLVRYVYRVNEQRIRQRGNFAETYSATRTQHRRMDAAKSRDKKNCA